MHIIDGSSPDPVGDFNAIQTELELFAEDLASKPQASCCGLACSGNSVSYQFYTRVSHRLSVSTVSHRRSALESHPVTGPQPVTVVVELPKDTACAILDHVNLARV